VSTKVLTAHPLRGKVLGMDAEQRKAVAAKLRQMWERRQALERNWPTTTPRIVWHLSDYDRRLLIHCGVKRED
jgi:hypothetical protein